MEAEKGAELRMRAKFITLEGGEGSGKSTHSKLLCGWLRKKGISFVYTREPGGTAIGEVVRKILLNPANHSIVDKCELLLYLSSRAQLVSEVIRPALSEGKMVISDRFDDATLAYQGYGDKLDIDLIKRLNNFVTENLRPDLTIFLDIGVKKGLLRSMGVKRVDRIEARAISYHQRVKKGYLELAGKNPGRIKIVKVRKGINETQREIRKIVEEKCLLAR